MCSCMPALRPFFARVISKVSIYSLSRKQTRSELGPEGGAVVEMGPYRSLEDAGGSGRGSTERTTRDTTGAGKGDAAGVRNIIDF